MGAKCQARHSTADLLAMSAHKYQASFKELMSTIDKEARSFYSGLAKDQDESNQLYRGNVVRIQEGMNR